jgi:hypothetical protein
MKIWIKIIVDHRVVRSVVRDVRDDYDGLIDDMRVICGEWDIPTPMILRSKYEQLMNFNMLKLVPDDFIESVNFDCLYLEARVDV